MEGQIKTIREDRGFGFIATNNGEEYFFHASQVGGAFFDLAEGDEVEFETQPSRKKPGKLEAVNVRTVN